MGLSTLFSKLAAGAAMVVVAAALTVAPGPAHAGSKTGAFLGGLAAGAIIGGAIAGAPYGYAYPAPPPPVYYAPPPPPVYYGGGPVYDDAVEYCLRRFRSYKPHTGTYTGFDGFEHPCP